MRSQEIIKAVMEKEGIKKADLATALGYATFRGLERLLDRPGSMNVDNCANTLRLLGYKVLAVPDNISVEAEGVFQIDA